jgi:hypothetical protein
METLTQIANVLLTIIRLGVIFRLVHCFIMIGVSEEEAGTYKRRMKHAIVFYIAAELIWQLTDLITSYYT